MKFVLAPLAEFSDAPFRRMCHEGGADLTFTEMVSAAALAHGHNPTRHLLEVMPGEGAVACQVFGAKEDEIAFAAREIDALDRFVELNLNAGCPMPNVTRCGAGAKLVEDPAKIYRLLVAMRENTALPVTLKTRVGPHPQRFNALEILDAAEKAGAAGITIHARFTSQVRGGEVHLDLLREIVSRSRIPVTGNGSVTDPKSAAAMAATGVDAIMIGRAALAEPEIFSRLKNAAARGKTAATGEPATERGKTAAPANNSAATGEPATERGKTAAPANNSAATGEPATERGKTGAHANDSTASDSSSVSDFERHLSYLLAFRRQLVERFPNDRIPSEDGFASVKMHTHLFRYFNGRPGAAALRARLNSVRTLAAIRAAVASFNPNSSFEGGFSSFEAVV